MVYAIVRHTCKDYAAWRPFFDRDRARRRDAGATGTEHVYRDLQDPNTITVVLQWDSAENAMKFMSDPALAQVMQEAGVVGAPAVAALTSEV